MGQNYHLVHHLLALDSLVSSNQRAYCWQTNTNY